MVGLAQDYCVAWTSLDSLELGLPTTVLTDHTRPVDPRSGEKMMEVRTRKKRTSPKIVGLSTNIFVAGCA